MNFLSNERFPFVFLHLSFPSLGINVVRLAHLISFRRMLNYLFTVSFKTVLGREHSEKVFKKSFEKLDFSGRCFARAC